MYNGYTLKGGVSIKQTGDFCEVGMGALGSRTLKSGMKGDDVTELQQMLIAYYAAKGIDAMPKYGADGGFGSETKTWVEKFQWDNKLKITGQANDEVLTLLSSSVKNSSSNGNANTVTADVGKNIFRNGPSKMLILGVAVSVVGLIGLFIKLKYRKKKR
jgi:peptidoglycan hydrolase-like protein with peptidoglycan-binding domain